MIGVRLVYPQDLRFTIGVGLRPVRRSRKARNDGISILAGVIDVEVVVTGILWAEGDAKCSLLSAAGSDASCDIEEGSLAHGTVFDHQHPPGFCQHRERLIYTRDGEVG